MEHVFGAAGAQALRVAMGRQPLLAFDFDGTLAPIVARPDDARVPDPIAERLTRLARLRPVAIVTGRSVADVSPRLGFAPHYIVGNHGAENPLEPRPAASAAALAALRVQLGNAAGLLGLHGVEVEDKDYSLALHYRQAPDADAARAAIDVALAGLDPRLASFGGKRVVNIVDATAPDKGDAVAKLVAQANAGTALFVGDDVNDETVFRRTADRWLTVRIGRDDPQSQAMYFLDDYTEMALLLQRVQLLLDPE
jgi:trehalose 6-phosphate phosphatase